MAGFFDVRKLVLLALGMVLAGPAFLYADEPGDAWAWSGHFQATVIPEYHFPFHAQYGGMNSLGDGPQFATSLTSTLFMGARFFPGLELYFDPELSAGGGLNGTVGVADFPNGEVSHVGSPQPHLNVARLYLQWVLGLGGPAETVESDDNQVAGVRDVSRLTLLAGKFSLADFFDDNSYSHDPRSQFMNWGLMDNGAWDYSADTHGYTDGLYTELNMAVWGLRFAEVQEPTVANGAVLDSDIAQSHSENLEAEARWSSWGQPGALRALGFWNHADMGNYRVTLDTPSYGMDIVDSRAPGTLKYGFGLNFEQEITKSLGFFSRAGWNNGRTESWAFTEVDQCASAGFQWSGDAWGRTRDHFGLATVISGLSAPHEEYLAAGGYGFILGDGALDYAPEQAYETYYSWVPAPGLSVSPDYQFLRNPGYNQARGPVHVVSLRVHYEI